MQLTPEEVDEGRKQALWLATCSILPMILKAAIELDLLEIIVRAGPGAKLSSADVVAQMPTRNPDSVFMVDRILQFLAANDIVKCTAETIADGSTLRKYLAAPICKYLTKNEDGESMASFTFLTLDSVLVESWHHLKDAVLEGGVSFNRAHGMSLFEYAGKNPRFNKVFNEVMENNSILITKQLLASYHGFDEVKVLVDVGGGVGSTLHGITSKYPHIKGINYDLPHVISEAPAISGVEHVIGDMLSSVPNGDAILLKWILHNWSDEHCQKILQNCWKALLKGGRVIILESFLPTTPQPTVLDKIIYNTALAMMAHIPGAKERTQRELETLVEKAGFSVLSTAYIGVCFWAIEARKMID